MSKLEWSKIMDIVFTYKRFMILDDKGNVFMSVRNCQFSLEHKFVNGLVEKIDIMAVANMYAVCDPDFDFECFIFRTVHGGLYSAGKHANNTLGLGRSKDISCLRGLWLFVLILVIVLH